MANISVMSTAQGTPVTVIVSWVTVLSCALSTSCISWELYAQSSFVEGGVDFVRPGLQFMYLKVKAAMFSEMPLYRLSMIAFMVASRTFRRHGGTGRV